MIPGHAVAFARDTEGAGLLHAIAQPTVEDDLHEADGEDGDSPLEALEDMGTADMELLAATMDFLVNFEEESLLSYPKLSMVIPAPMSVPDSQPPSPLTQWAMVSLCRLFPYLGHRHRELRPSAALI